MFSAGSDSLRPAVELPIEGRGEVGMKEPEVNAGDNRSLARGWGTGITRDAAFSPNGRDTRERELTQRAICRVWLVPIVRRHATKLGRDVFHWDARQCWRRECSGLEERRRRAGLNWCSINVW